MTEQKTFNFYAMEEWQIPNPNYEGSKRKAHMIPKKGPHGEPIHVDDLSKLIGPQPRKHLYLYIPEFYFINNDGSGLHAKTNKVIKTNLLRFIEDILGISRDDVKCGIYRMGHERNTLLYITPEGPAFCYGIHEDEMIHKLINGHAEKHPNENPDFVRVVIIANEEPESVFGKSQLTDPVKDKEWLEERGKSTNFSKKQGIFYKRWTPSLKDSFDELFNYCELSFEQGKIFYHN